MEHFSNLAKKYYGMASEHAKNGQYYLASLFSVFSIDTASKAALLKVRSEVDDLEDNVEELRKAIMEVANSGKGGAVVDYLRRLLEINHRLEEESKLVLYGNPLSKMDPEKIYDEREAKNLLKLAGEALKLSEKLLS